MSIDKTMKNIVLGILAHVDAGKTTLSEGLLYTAGEIRSFGRVDSKNTLLDNDELERARGITIFSKQAEFNTNETHFTLLDTPGHVDFSAEMERTLQVLDYAVLVISGSDGVQGHTSTLWKLLKQYKIPVFIFVNKMDMPDNDRLKILELLHTELSECCVDFGDGGLSEAVMEEVAILSQNEALVDFFLNNNYLNDSDIAESVRKRRVFPCFFGSALKLDGVKTLIDGLDRFTVMPEYRDDFAAKVYKITRDSQGSRLTHIKITGGSLSVKDVVCGDEKVNQIRIYSGRRYETSGTVESGRICAVTGLISTYAGMGLGADSNLDMRLLEPVLTYSLKVPDSLSSRQIYPSLKLLEEEMPELCLEWNGENEEILIKLMGQVQLEILGNIINNRFGFTPEFGTGSITYKETIADTVIGVGHFEPLKHYAEVHLLMEPGARGSGLEIVSDCSEDILDKNWQRLIMTHLKERKHPGVLTGSSVTDIKITVINGRAHQKHTEGGDFRQATYRAVRQGLMQAESVLLEPYYSFRLDIPSDMVGRAMNDIENMSGNMDAPLINEGKVVITGTAPVSSMRDYQINVNSYTKGLGSLFVSFSGYGKCHNQEAVVAEMAYNAESDSDNPSSSVFCAHGSGFIVPWYQVEEYMHVTDETGQDMSGVRYEAHRNTGSFDYTIDLEEIDEIFSRTFEANRKTGKHEYKKNKIPIAVYNRHSMVNNYSREKMLIVDGYNVIFAWDELKALADINIDSAKDRLIHVLSNYQGMTDIKLMLVFDGYRVKGNRGSEAFLDNITVIYTKEGETADQFIEKFANNNRESYNITVATSDGLIQQITRGLDCFIISSRELQKLINEAAEEFRNSYNI